MAKSYNIYTGDGSTNQFNLTFAYLSKDHVVVSINGVSQDFTWVNDTRVQTDATPPVGAVVRINRQTPTNPLTVYPTTSTLKAADLNRALKQSLYLAEENGDDAGSAASNSLHLPIGDSTNGTIPSVADRAGKVAGYNLDGTPGVSEFSLETINDTAENAIAAAATAGSDLFQRPVIDILSTPPGSPVAGDRYLVAHSGTTGAFIGAEDQVAEWRGTQWVFSGVAVNLQRLVIRSLSIVRYWMGTAWVSGSSIMDSYLRVATGAVVRSVSDKVGDHVSVLDFGTNTNPGVTDMTAAVQAALNTGKDVLVPSGVYLITSKLSMSTPYQKLFGHGQLSELRFTFTSDAIGLEITNSTGRQQVSNIFLNATAHVTKLVSVAAPMVTLKASRFVNATSTGYVIYAEDENIGSNIFTFGLMVLDNFIYGSLVSGAAGIQLGNNTQCAHIIGNYVENCGTLIVMTGNMSNVTVAYNVLQRSVDRAVFMGRAAQNLYVNVNFHHNYSEQNQVVFVAGAGEFHNCSIKWTYAYRNTASKTASYFYLAQGTASSASTGWVIEDNYVEDFFTFLELVDQYSSLMASVQRNVMNNVTMWVDGNFPDSAYSVVNLNSYYRAKITSGSMPGPTNVRCECLNVTYEMEFPVEWRQYLSHITFNYIQVSGTGVTVELHKVSATGTSDTTVATTGNLNTDGVKTLAVEAQIDPTAHYYLKVIVNNTGAAGYIYPFRAYFRQ